MPRMRNTPAIVPAIDNATIARRNIFMGGSYQASDAVCPPAADYGAAMELRVVRLTTNFEEACLFYGALLGLPVTRQWPASEAGGQGCIFGYGDVGRMELIESEHAELVSGVFLAIEVPDVSALHDRLLTAGGVILRGLADQPWGHRNFAVLDPTGLELVFFEWITDN